jgi:UDP-N-acetyl-D-glucosamine dehydrogenase
MKIGIIGQGYVGLSLAISAAKSGHTVIGFDINDELIKDLEKSRNRNSSEINADLSELIKKRAYIPTNNPMNLGNCTIIVIAVPTPLDINRKPDLTFLNQACEIIGKYIKSKVLIVNESTSYPGTLRDFISSKIFEKSKIRHLYATAPERIDPGNKHWNVVNTPRVIGALDSESLVKATEFYSTISKNIVQVSSAEAAEMAKLLENSFRQVNIAFVNEISQITHALGLDIYEILEAAATKPFGFMRFEPGAGVGGHCIPVDPTYLSYRASEIGVPSKFIETANEINLNMPLYIYNRILRDHDNDIKGKKVLIIGISYKKNIADVRESPAIAMYRLFKSSGIDVDWHDPLVQRLEDTVSSNFGIYDIGVIMVLHDKIDRRKLKEIPYIFDCTNEIKWAKKL